MNKDLITTSGPYLFDVWYPFLDQLKDKIGYSIFTKNM